MGEHRSGQLEGMPEPYRLRRVQADGETIIFRGPYVVGRYEDDDVALRNLVIVSLREAGHSGREVADCFGLSGASVSMLWSRTKTGSSLDRVDLGQRQFSSDEIDDGDHLGLGAISTSPPLRRLDE